MIVNKQVAKTIENKSQARRVILNIDDIRLLDNYFSEDRSSDKFSLEIFIKATAKWKVGDILWVKEPARVTSFNRIFKNGVKRDTIKAKYIADGKEVINTNVARFRNYNIVSDYSDWILYRQGMPSGCIKEMARHFKRVTHVRVERLQDITIKDIFKEGFSGEISDYFIADKYHKKAIEGCFSDNQQDIAMWFVNLWDSTAPKGYKWEDNPYVFVHDLETVEVES